MDGRSGIGRIIALSTVALGMYISLYPKPTWCMDTIRVRVQTLASTLMSVLHNAKLKVTKDDTQEDA